jgi:hypothetical protein
VSFLILGEACIVYELIDNNGRGIYNNSVYTGKVLKKGMHRRTKSLKNGLEDKLLPAVARPSYKNILRPLRLR